MLIHYQAILKSMTLVPSATQRPVRGTLSKEFLVVNNNNYDDVLCTCMIPSRYPIGILILPWYRLEITTWWKRKSYFWNDSDLFRLRTTWYCMARIINIV